VFAAGALLGLRFPLGGAAVALATAVCVFFPAAFNGLVPGRALYAAFAVIGWSSGSGAASAALRDCRARFADGTSIVALAVLDGKAEAGGSIALRFERVRAGGVEVECRGSVRARLPARLPELEPGAHVAVTGSWWPWPKRSAWPSPPEHAGVLSIRNLKTVSSNHGHPLLEARSRALAHVSKLFHSERALAEALIMAHRESLDTEVRQDFAASGLTHLLAISGSHVGVVAAMILLVARMARIRERRAAALATACATAYVLFLGAPAAAARAALQGVSLFASRLAQRPADALSLLALAALILVAQNPLVLLDIGFQLSFAGVFGLIAFRRAALRVLPGGLPRSLNTALGATLAATFTTSPIVAFHFGLVSWISPIANLVAGPLVALAVPALALALVANPVHSQLSGFLAGGAELLLTLLRRTAHVSAQLPASHSYVSFQAVSVSLIAFVAAVLVIRGKPATVPDENGKARRRALLLALRGAVGLSVLAAWPFLWPASRGGVEIHAIDVGQGDAFAIRTPRGHWLLIDAGPVSGRFDAGRSTVAPYLLDRGAARIDAVILTHPHLDHIGGVLAIWRMFDVGPVLDPAVAAGQEYYADVLEEARRRRIRWIAARAGREIRIDDLTLRILAPTDSLLDGSIDPNDFSVVFRLEYGRFAALFLGDAPRAVENRLVAEHGTNIAADLIKVGHHGSRTSTGDSLLDVVRPRLALVSVGRRNRYGHPNSAVIQRLQQRGVQIVRTDESGSMIIRARADGTLQLVRGQ
jgi:competence protein ComEC